MTATALASITSENKALCPPWWRQARVGLIYWWRHGRWPAHRSPVAFTEWVQWRKLYDRCPDLAALTDKSAAKALVEAALGAEFIIPTLWSGIELPTDPPAPLPLMVKANHGCGQYLAIRSLNDWERAREMAPGWLRRPYGTWLDEWHYGGARRMLIVEPLIGSPGVAPIDYKIYVFHGRAAMVQVHEGRGFEHRWAQLDRDWHALSNQRTAVPRPASLDRMVEAAERLAAQHDFLRVDFYEEGGQPLFGEFCLFPGSGLDAFDPPSLDAWLGQCWSGATLTAVAQGRRNGVDRQLDPVAHPIVGLAGAVAP